MQVQATFPTARTRINDPCATVGSPKFPPVEKGRKTHQKSVPRDWKKRKKRKKHQIILREATPTS